MKDIIEWLLELPGYVIGGGIFIVVLAVFFALIYIYLIRLRGGN